MEASYGDDRASVGGDEELIELLMTKHRSFRLTSTPSDGSIGEPSRTARTKYAEAVATALLQHAVTVILAALILDGGRTLRFCAIAVIASWLCTLMILLRRPKQPTNFDLAIIKYGFWPMMFIVTVIGIVRELIVR